MHKSITRFAAVCLALIICSIGASNSFADMIDLSKVTQGSGNKGASYRPLDQFGGPASFIMTARTSIDLANPYDPDATGLAGTIVISNSNGIGKGAGVQTAGGTGSAGISGTGCEGAEELIFWYDQAVTLGSLSVALEDIQFGSGEGSKDDPVIFLSLAGSGNFGVTIRESEIMAAFISTGSKAGTIDFGSFTSISSDTQIVAFSIRETHNNIAVGAVSGGDTIPEPASLCLLMTGGGVMIFKRKTF